MHTWLSPLLAILVGAAPVCAGQQTATPAPAGQSPAAGQAPPPSPVTTPFPMVQDLKVSALAGDQGMNDLERHVMSPLVVQVLDQNDRPVEGAEVVFRFPLNGPSATFRNGNSSQTVRTNGQGQASATNWMANSKVGKFSVRVTASYGNELGEATISMTNVNRVVDNGKGGHPERKWYSSKWTKIALISGGAALVAGIILATRGGSSSSPSVIITPGTPTVGSPH